MWTIALWEWEPNQVHGGGGAVKPLNKDTKGTGKSVLVMEVSVLRPLFLLIFYEF